MNLKNKLKMVKMADIKPYAKNAKKHPKHQIDLIVDSLKNNDYYSPIGVDSSGEIVIGHGRFEAMKQIKSDGDLIEVVDFGYLDAKQIKKLRIMDNKIVSDEWDKELLQEEIEAIYDDAEQAIKELNLSDDDLILPEEMDEIGLPEGDNDFEQMTFVLSRRQAEIVKNTIEQYKDFVSEDNENKNGNALEAICQELM